MHQQTLTWMESAELQQNFAFAGGEQAQSGTKVWRPLPGADSEQFSVYVVPSEVTPILFGLHMTWQFGLVIDASLSHVGCNTTIRRQDEGLNLSSFCSVEGQHGHCVVVLTTTARHT